MKVSKEEILNAIADMSVMDVVELVSAMEERFGVSATAVVATTVQTKDCAVAVEEQTEFDVVLTSFGEKKVAVIKVVRGLTGLGLKEAKDMVESAPVSVKEGINKSEATDVKKQLEEAGASVEIK